MMPQPPDQSPDATTGSEATSPAPLPAADFAPASPIHPAESKGVADDVMDFGALLESYATPAAHPERGEEVEGRVMRIGLEHVFVDVGAKEEGVIDKAELMRADGTLSVVIGDVIRATVLDEDSPYGGIRLSRRLSGESADHEGLAQAYRGQIPVQGKVEKQIKGGYEVRVGASRAFCPISQIELGRTANPEVHLGMTYDFLISEFADRRFVVSRAALQHRERDEAKARLRETLAVGQVLKGRVSKLREFGAFVDIGGIEGLVHVSELSWGHVDNPADVVKEGQEVSVKVLRLDWSQQDRISLSMKSAEEDPWKTVGDRLKVGEQYRGTVARLTEFGAFVELAPGVDGLVHISEMSWTQRVRRPSDILAVGDQVDVQVLGIDLAQRRVSLGMKQVMRNPWEDVSAKYVAGAQVTGTVARVQNFGVFVDLEPGVTALLPASESATDRNVPLIRHFPPGSSLTARVLDVDVPNRRLTLSRKDAEERRDDDSSRSEGRDYDGGRGARGSRMSRPEPRESLPKPSREGLGTFADLLGDKLRNFGKDQK